MFSYKYVYFHSPGYIECMHGYTQTIILIYGALGLKLQGWFLFVVLCAFHEMKNETQSKLDYRKKLNGKCGKSYFIKPEFFMSEGFLFAPIYGYLWTNWAIAGHGITKVKKTFYK